ncbi:hypothetical protein [Roseovarius sp. D0-M9]|uniref:hypothetical protein n=1 Tax=Roseovarius sp. D0-M9 TaxID=3127117 RepID=UPI00300F89B3
MAFFFIVSTIVGLIWALLAQVALLTAWAFVTYVIMFDKGEDERYPSYARKLVTA